MYTTEAGKSLHSFSQLLRLLLIFSFVLSADIHPSIHRHSLSHSLSLSFELCRSFTSFYVHIRSQSVFCLDLLRSDRSASYSPKPAQAHQSMFGAPMQDPKTYILYGLYGRHSLTASGCSISQPLFWSGSESDHMLLLLSCRSSTIASGVLPSWSLATSFSFFVSLNFSLSIARSRRSHYLNHAVSLTHSMPAQPRITYSPIRSIHIYVTRHFIPPFNSPLPLSIELVTGYRVRQFFLSSSCLCLSVCLV